MATYLELFQLRNNSDLQDRVITATVVAAEAVRAASVPLPNQPAREVWAARVFENPKAESVRMLWAVLAANKDSTIAQITGADDTVLQAAVDAAVDIFANNPVTP